jgi:hypothetical protein
MTLTKYFFSLGIGALILLVAAFPVLFATLVAWMPGRRPRYKASFVIVCSIIAFGVAGLMDVVALPFALAADHLAPQMEHDGYVGVATAINSLAELFSWVPLVGLALASVLVPVCAGAKLWGRLVDALAGRDTPRL